MQLKESKDLYKGIFWIIDIDNPYSSKDYCFTILSDSNGNPLSDQELNSKNGLTYNHKKVWEEINTKISRKYPYNYFPRGRVEIHNNKAIIYCNPNIADRIDCIDFIIETFNLTKYNNIEDIRVISDGSEHYKCYLD